MTLQDYSIQCTCTCTYLSILLPPLGLMHFYHYIITVMITCSNQRISLQSWTCKCAFTHLVNPQECCLFAHSWFRRHKCNENDNKRIWISNISIIIWVWIFSATASNYMWCKQTQMLGLHTLLYFESIIALKGKSVAHQTPCHRWPLTEWSHLFYSYARSLVSTDSPFHPWQTRISLSCNNSHKRHDTTYTIPRLLVPMLSRPGGPRTSKSNSWKSCQCLADLNPKW